MSNFDAPFADGCAAGELRLQKCGQCGTYRFPASPICPNCLSAKAEWVAVSGRGTVWSWIRMHQRYFKDLPRETPYNLLLVQLAEGPMMISACDDENAALRVGDAVGVTFREVGGEMLPYFARQDVEGSAA